MHQDIAISNTRLSAIKQQGFTLIEVMLALAIVSIALAALSRSMGLTVANQAQLEERIVATWVAQNELLKLEMLEGKEREKITQVSLLNREWQTELLTEPTLIPGIHKAVMQVSAEKGKVISASLVTVVGE